tara:strand:- start:246 stop:473 length:228 start_codon:yes stop_codon:yes gene_type:complete
LCGEKVTDESDKQGQAETPAKGRNAHDKVEQSARREALGTGLRRAYQKVLSEPIPDEFSQLLDRLSQSDGKEDPE